MNTLYVRCQIKDYILDIVAARAGMRINKVNSDKYFKRRVNILQLIGRQSNKCYKQNKLNYSLFALILFYLE